jgi:SNF2 family DNA or RNA helicase
MDNNNFIKLYSSKYINFTIIDNNEYLNTVDIIISGYNIKENKYILINQNYKEFGLIALDALKLQEYFIINEVNNTSDLWNYKIHFLNEIKRIKSIDFLININTLYNKLLSNTLRQCDIDAITFGTNLNRQFLNFRIHDTWKEPQIKHINNDNKQPYMNGIKLYSYQLRTLQWLKHIESTIYKEGIKYSSVIPLNELLNVDKFNNYYFDYINQEIITNENITKKLTFKGGILADEMGLGKTITTISLIIDKPRNDLNINLKKLNEINIELNQNEKIKIKANLIICPSHLAKQWYSEIIRCNPLMKVLLITTKPQHENITYKDILEANVVIVSFQFLSNIQYYPSINYKKITMSQLYNNFNERIYLLNTTLKNILNDKNKLLTLKQPILEHFEWYRIIVDEAHEIFSTSIWNRNHIDSFLNNLLLVIDCVFKWYISGTPFTNEDGFRSVMQFLEMKSYSKQNIIIRGKNEVITKCLDFKNLIERGMNEQTLYNDIMKQLYCRNTKANIGDEWNVPSIIEETIFMNLTNIEKGIYEQGKHYGSIYLRQICCHPNISEKSIEALGCEELSLEDVRLKLIDYKKSLITDNLNKISALDINKDEHNYDNKRKQLISKNKDLEYEIRFFTNLDPIVPKLPEDSCPICMSEFDNVVVTDCGHYYCKECILNALNMSKKTCPMCRQSLSMKNIYSIKKSEDTAVDYLTFKYGSKMGKLISICKQILNDETARIIIFSQWERLLLNIGKTLKENNINNVNCRGNINVKNATIKTFKEGIHSGIETKVIMLSLENSASGTNLTEATHIILIDPVDGTKEEIKAIENQAIGRAARIGQKRQVKVIRLITKNTIEEEIYKKSL